MGKIGFNWGWEDWNWGKKSSVSKWEKSLYGGFHRLVSDYPRVIVDYKVDFDFAKIKYLDYFEKEKICKIFLSKAKINSLIDTLVMHATTTSETNMLGEKIIKTTLSRIGKDKTISKLMSEPNENEYHPFFEHYRDFILDSDFYFEKPQNQQGSSSSNPSGKNDQSESKDQNNKDNNKEQQQSQSPEQNQSNDNSNDGENKKEDQEKSQGSGDSSSNESIYNQNVIDFKISLENIREDEYNYESLSTYDKKVKTIFLKCNNSETDYSQQEKDVADRLTKMLDISFDPASDTVKNLRLGKLDVAKIAEVPAGNIAIYKQTVENQTTKPFSVAILCDESGSMLGRNNPYGKTKLHHQYSMIKSLYLSFSDILPPEKIFIYGHSGHSSPHLYVYHDPYNQNFVKTIDNMMGRHDESLEWNYDGPVIEHIHKNIRTTTNDRIIFIVLSDGLPNGAGNYGYKNPADIVNMKQIIEKCKRDDFITVGIGIVEQKVHKLYQYGVVVDDLCEMPKKVSYIINHVVKTEFK